MLVDKIRRGGGNEYTAYVCAKTPVNKLVYSVDETFEWSLPFLFCSELGIVDKQQEESVGYVTAAFNRELWGLCQYVISSLTVWPLL